jgi:hypothetical protein
MSSIFISPFMPRNIQAKRWIRPDLVPSAWYAAALHQASNHIGRWRRKELFRYHGQVVSIPASVNANTELWSFYCHTGNLAAKMRFVVGMGMASTADYGDNVFKDPRVEIAVTKVGAGTTTLTVRYGLSGEAVTDAPSNLAFLSTETDVDADSDYTVTVTAREGGRAFALMAHEIAEEADTDNGYLFSSYSVFQPILRTDRQNVHLALTNAWRHNAAPLATWSRHNAAATISSSTYTNVIDGTTSNTAASAGFRLDTRFLRTIIQTGVPVRLALKAACTGGTDTGKVRFTDGTNHLEFAGIDAADQWYTADFNMPASQAKWDLQFAATSGTLTLHAVSLFQYQA